jgi:hypothetical protein
MLHGRLSRALTSSVSSEQRLLVDAQQAPDVERGQLAARRARSTLGCG